MEIAQPDIVTKIKMLRSEGRSMGVIADEVQVSSRTVWKIVNRAEAEVIRLSSAG
jgi:orotate phosphoribosyltransferase-like protein